VVAAGREHAKGGPSLDGDGLARRGRAPLELAKACLDLGILHAWTEILASPRRSVNR